MSKAVHMPMSLKPLLFKNRKGVLAVTGSAEGDLTTLADPSAAATNRVPTLYLSPPYRVYRTFGRFFICATELW